MLNYQQLLPDAIERVNLKRKFEQSSLAELFEITKSTEEQYEPPNVLDLSSGSSLGEMRF